jgi:hypothetical protein
MQMIILMKIKGVVPLMMKEEERGVMVRVMLPYLAQPSLAQPNSSSS